MRSIAIGVVCISIGSALAEEAAGAIVIWSPEDAEQSAPSLRLSLEGLTHASGTGLELTWHPCGSGASQVQNVASFDLVNGVKAEFTVDMCGVDVVFDEPVLAMGSQSGVSYVVQLDDLGFTLEPDNDEIDASFAVLAGSVQGDALLTVRVP